MAYSIEGLEHGIERCDVNIKSLEEAIEKERQTKKDYRVMIDNKEKADREMAHAKANMKVSVEVIEED